MIRRTGAAAVSVVRVVALSLQLSGLPVFAKQVMHRADTEFCLSLFSGMKYSVKEVRSPSRE